ncbi:cytochrome C oxidase subunit IV family protein [Mycobacterium sp. CVI_P3]|uniref:Cytochrome C oxidase subunit IV family protein n=1 Tax=Mycobacterium pinniadriaticum TaxID=2994102 RepID=A0ABT3SC90_9MYCO|nr:cytochrome C oxidase subunit IV family protein [Mycobacterium pinniadriaticum]MCX2930701.1 cytochrome C oxidase subunit IV family protein [Mycobacterium pinniadriaticum]MCX2937125.1 cytochrome C oxidase subunit IV family protein [Mycobacterium pinniadriaticum]
MTTLWDNNASLKKTAVTVGVVLAVITAGSYLLGIDHLLGFSRMAMAVILVAAFVKVWFVTQYFMDIRHSPRWLQMIVNGWTVLSAAVVVGLYVWL